MGRNAGSKVMFTMINDGTNYIGIYYCQQHGEWDLFESTSPATALFNWRGHMNAEHGNTEQ